LLKDEYSVELQNLMDFFDRMSEMVERGALDKNMAYNSFAGRLTRYWTAARPVIEKERIEHDSPFLWEDTEKVYNHFLKMRAERWGRADADVSPTPEQIERFLQSEASLPTTFD
jgi:hypothetical protein